MYEVADKYEAVGLKELAKEKFSRGRKHFWDTLDSHIAANHAFLKPHPKMTMALHTS
jgi:hypothetical protein